MTTTMTGTVTSWLEGVCGGEHWRWQRQHCSFFEVPGGGLLARCHPPFCWIVPSDSLITISIYLTIQSHMKSSLYWIVVSVFLGTIIQTLTRLREQYEYRYWWCVPESSGRFQQEWVHLLLCVIILHSQSWMYWSPSLSMWLYYLPELLIQILH